MSIINDLLRLSDEEYLITKELLNIFIYTNNKLNIYQLQEILRNKYINVDINTLYKLVNYIQVKEGKIIRDDYIGSFETYSIIPKMYYRSKYSENYESFKANSSLNKLLLVSDTHIGNGFYNEELLNKIYDFAYSCGVRVAFHLGDLFEGPKRENYSLEEQLKLFKDTYPTNIMTYGIKGNHDVGIDDYLKVYGIDLRSLTTLNNHFYMFPIRNNYYKCSTECLYLNDFKIKLTHEAYASDYYFNSYESLNIDSILEYDKIADKLSDKYNLILSGHRHKGLITNIKKEGSNKNNLYLSVPSTSNYCINSSVGFILEFNYKDNKVSSIDINTLYYDGNVDVKDTINYDYNKDNKILKGIIKRT